MFIQVSCQRDTQLRILGLRLRLLVLLITIAKFLFLYVIENISVEVVPTIHQEVKYRFQ